MRSLMWFRSDLRLQDNTALHHACKAADKGVIAVFAICPRQWADHDWGSMKVDFVLRNVRALSEDLAKWRCNLSKPDGCYENYMIIVFNSSCSG